MSWLSLGVTEMSRQFIYGQIARLGKANKAAQVAAQWDPPGSAIVGVKMW